MNTNNTTIVVDAMGGDNSPFKVLKGIEIFNQSHSNCNILLFGDKNIINNTLESHSLKLNNIEIFNTTDNIKDNDTANTILRKKKNSSIFQGLNHVKNNRISYYNKRTYCAIFSNDNIAFNYTVTSNIRFLSNFNIFSD